MFLHLIVHFTETFISLIKCHMVHWGEPDCAPPEVYQESSTGTSVENSVPTGPATHRLTKKRQNTFNKQPAYCQVELQEY